MACLASTLVLVVLSRRVKPSKIVWKTDMAPSSGPRTQQGAGEDVTSFTMFLWVSSALVKKIGTQNFLHL